MLETPFPRPDLRVTDGNLAIRAMRDEDADYANVTRWRREAHVAEWFGGQSGPLDQESVHKKYWRRIRGYEDYFPCILELEGNPIGYLQFFPVSDLRYYGLEGEGRTYGIALFLGGDGRESGVGSRALRAMVTHLFTEWEASRVVADPQAKNMRAVRSYEKAGFRRDKILRGHDVSGGVKRDSVLMVAERNGGS